jgi:predicted amidohydrolase
LVRVAALQMNSGIEPGPNLDALGRLAKAAAARGATYALSPEVSIVYPENREQLRGVAGPWEDNPSVARCAEIARETGLWLHVGSLAVALPDGRFANRSVLFRPDGSLAATYDKIHLVDATLPGLKAYRESDTYAGGDSEVFDEAAVNIIAVAIGSHLGDALWHPLTSE